MKTSTEKIICLLLTNPKKEWKQIELAKKAGCTKAFLSKLTKKMVSQGILARPKSQQIIVISIAKLLNRWCSIRKLPKPIYIKTNLSKQQIEKKMKKESNYALTLFSAAWHRVKFMKTNTIEAYVKKGKVMDFIKKFGSPVKNPTNFIIYPEEKQVFENIEKIRGLCLVHVIQNYVDLTSISGTGIRVAHELDKKYNLRGI
jgi:hypothetical protein